MKVVKLVSDVGQLVLVYLTHVTLPLCHPEAMYGYVSNITSRKRPPLHLSLIIVIDTDKRQKRCSRHSG